MDNRIITSRPFFIIVIAAVCILMPGLIESVAGQQGFNWQGVLRDANGTPLGSKDFTIVFSAKFDGVDGEVILDESHSVTTNPHGVASLKIGSNTPDLLKIDWSKGPYSLQWSVGGGIDISGATELSMVPLAAYAFRSGNSGGPLVKEFVKNSDELPNPYDGDVGDIFVTENDGNVWSWNGEMWIALEGLRGPQGAAGTGVTIVGSVPTESELDLEYLGNIGDLIIIQDTGSGAVWDGNTWILVGQIRGPEGDTGPAGPAGSQGDPGSAGATGPQGPAGQNGSGVTIIGSVATDADLIVNYTGNVGDMVIVEADGGGYVWDGSVWINVGQIQGPEGPIGPQGEIGPTGPEGPQGLKGDQGDAGVAGPSGLPGDQGLVGPKGDQGNPGPQGAIGPAGPDGSQGPKGDQGDVGPQGPEGPAGTYTAGTGIQISNNVLSNIGDTNGDDDVNTNDNAGGDVSGTFSNLEVEGIKGFPISSTLFLSNQVLKYNNNNWILSDNDFSNTNEIQTIQNLEGSNISLSGSSGTVVDISALPGVGPVWSKSGSAAYYDQGQVKIQGAASSESVFTGSNLSFYNNSGNKRVEIFGANEQLRMYSNGGTTEVEINSDGLKTREKLAVGSINVSGSFQAFIASENDHPLLVNGKGSNTGLMVTQAAGVSIGVQNPSTPQFGLYVQGETELNNNLDIAASKTVTLGSSTDLNMSNANITISTSGNAFKPGGGPWNASSDIRLKKDIREYSRGLQDLLNIDPVAFRYNGVKEADNGNEFVGVIAQDLQKVLPNMVGQYDDSDYLYVDPNEFTYMLINAVKELAKENTLLKQENGSLEDRIHAIEKIIINSTN